MRCIRTECLDQESDVVMWPSLPRLCRITTPAQRRRAGVALQQAPSSITPMQKGLGCIPAAPDFLVLLGSKRLRHMASAGHWVRVLPAVLCDGIANASSRLVVVPGPMCPASPNSRGCTRNRPMLDDDCRSDILSSHESSASLRAAAKSVQTFTEFRPPSSLVMPHTHNLWRTKSSKAPTSARPPALVLTLSPLSPPPKVDLSHLDRMRKDPVPISNPLERPANVMRSWVPDTPVGRLSVAPC
ncbi:hypothetical protein LZ30DRAFT_185688 [Colletotrichum cereale]|nr:hypothetical protein LZ30DRAFT_185688 [Colletotrichum cereale]